MEWVFLVDKLSLLGLSFQSSVKYKPLYKTLIGYPPRAVSKSDLKCDRQVIKALLCKEKKDDFNSFDIFCLNQA
jgi:hypothetical protein